MHVSFVAGRSALSRWHNASRLQPDDVYRQQQRFRSGIDVWVVQTYLLLRDQLAELGHRVTLDARFPAGALCVAHWDSYNAFFSGAHACRVIGVRADRPPMYGCARVVVQNNLVDDDPTHRFIPLWPQPGLVPRDRARGARIENIAYFGRATSLEPWIERGDLRQRLAALGVTLRVCERSWNDYSDVDLVLSARAESPTMLAHKPATKLYNAWLAEVPALLSDEPAFRSLRGSTLDYLTVSSVDDIVESVARLRKQPETYQAMIERGRERGRDFAREAIAARWIALLQETGGLDPARASLYTHLVAILRQKRAAKHFRRLHARDLRHALAAK